MLRWLLNRYYVYAAYEVSQAFCLSVVDAGAELHSEFIAYHVTESYQQ